MIAPEWITAVFTVVLSVATIALAIATYGLIKATKHLARIQIRPKLSLLRDPYYLGDSRLRFDIINRGIGTAYNVKMVVKTPTEVPVKAEIDSGSSEITPNVMTSFSIPQSVSGLRFRVIIDYEDAEGYKYHEPDVEVITPPT